MPTHWRCQLPGCPNTRVTDPTDKPPMCNAANDAHQRHASTPGRLIAQSDDFVPAPMVPDLDAEAGA
jgi:hypothetical protein